MFNVAATVLTHPLGAKALHQGIGLIVRGSWKKVAEFYSEKYGADPEIQKETSDLDMKLKIIQQPLDICAQHVAKGNQAMEGARDVTLAILKDIDELIQDITNFRIREARNEPHPNGIATPVQWAKRLKNLRQRLDSLIPYLNLAISASNLAPCSEEKIPRLSRLLWASDQLQNAKRKSTEDTSFNVFALEQATLLVSGRKGWETKFMDCRVQLSVNRDFQKASMEHPFSYTLSIEETFPDDKVSLNFSEDEEDKETQTPNGETTTTGRIIVPLRQISRLDWSTSQAMELIEADFSPALIIAVKDSKTSDTTDWKSFAIQCRFRSNQLEESSVNKYSEKFTEHKENTVESIQREWDTLGKLEYLLHLTILETRYNDSHTRIQDSYLLNEFGCSSFSDGHCDLESNLEQMQNLELK